MHELVRYIQRSAFNTAFKQLGAQNIEQLIDLEIGLAQHLDGFIGIVQFNSRLYATKVKTRLNLANRVIHAVTRFLQSTSETISKDGIFSSPFIFVALHNTCNEA